MDIVTAHHAKPDMLRNLPLAVWVQMIPENRVRFQIIQPVSGRDVILILVCLTKVTVPSDL